MNLSRGTPQSKSRSMEGNNFVDGNTDESGSNIDQGTPGQPAPDDNSSAVSESDPEGSMNFATPAPGLPANRRPVRSVVTPAPTHGTPREFVHGSPSPEPDPDPTPAQPSVIQDLSFSSEFHTVLPRDFEGFPERGRSKHRSKSKSKSKKRKRRRRSSSSSSSSSSGHRHRRRHRQDADTPTAALSQLVALLSQSVDRISGVCSTTNSQADTQSTSQAPQSANSNHPDRSSTAPAPTSHHEPDQVEDPVSDPSLREQPVFQDDVLDPQLQDEYPSDDSDDEPITGTEFSSDAFDKAVEVIRRQLGFDPPEPEQSSLRAKSKLSLNKPSKPSRSIMPVDTECFDRFETHAKAKRWRAYPRKSSSDFRIADDDYKAFFSAPSLPVSCMDKLKESNAMDQRGRFTSPSTKKSYSSLHNIDLAARTGMKFASALLLFAEVLSKSFRQSGTEQVPRSDTGALVNLLGPIARLSYDQFVRVAVRATHDKRELVLDNINWPSKDIQQRFMDLPFEGSDLFGGKFDDQLSLEIKRKKDMNKAEFSFSKPPSRPPRSSQGTSSRRPSRHAGFPTRRPSSSPQFARGSYRSQTSSRGSTGPSTSFSGRRPYRGYYRGSSRGAGRSSRP